MRFRCLLLLALPLMLCTCGPARASDGAADGEYWPVHDTLPPPPPEGLAGLTQQRFVLEGDSIYTYAPGYGMGERYAAYQADSTTRYTDSLYVVYQLRNDSTLELVMHTPTGTSPNRVLRRRPAGLRPLALPDSVAGHTYRFELDSIPLLLYFATATEPMATLTLREGTTHAPVQLRRNDPIVGEDGQPSIGISFAESVGTNRVMIHRLLVCATERGEPQIYLIPDERSGKRITGPFSGSKYASAVPETEADQNVVSRLQLGGIEVQLADIDTSERYALRSLSRFWQVAEEQLGRLDFEFRDDGKYILLVGNEVVEEGNWGLSTDRNFLMLGKQDRQGLPGLYPLTEYTDEYLALNLSVDAFTADGEVYLADVSVRFYAP